MRIMTWNVHRAHKGSLLWQYVSQVQPDLLLLQEVGSIPNDILQDFDHLLRPATTRLGKPQKFHTGVLVKGTITGEIALSSDCAWVNRELQFFHGNLISCTVELHDGTKFEVMSVHSPAWPVDNSRS
jgi:exonuclease III